ncbi:MAG TPA: molybdenum cofactor biosynthesis protein MoaE [Terriglobales bacterium]|nr:molybdenum cofactor biosynthesis protein MoaE [Terriglobales bacterium]
MLFFGSLRDMAGKTQAVVRLPEGSTVQDLLTHFQKEMPRLSGILPSLALSVNLEYARSEMRLHDQDEVALLPPVSGGSEAGVPEGALKQPEGKRCRLVREAINVQAEVEALKQPEDGAVVVFEGVVRNHSRGRRTQFLDYSAYEPMAIKQMDQLVEESLSNFAIREARIVHRLGRLEIGETSVLIAVSSAHRVAAFDACRWLIDTLKRAVPIWKREHFADGAVWADGEPFPEEIAARPLSSSAKPASK